MTRLAISLVRCPVQTETAESERHRFRPLDFFIKIATVTRETLRCAVYENRLILCGHRTPSRFGKFAVTVFLVNIVTLVLIKLCIVAAVLVLRFA